MPKGTRVERCVNKLKAEGDDKYNPYAVCQASTKQSYKTGKPLKKKGKKKMKAQTESLLNFINSLKTPENETFVENVILKGFNVCFEAEDIPEDEAMQIPDDPEEADEVKKKIDEVQAAQEITKLKKEELQDVAEDV